MLRKFATGVCFVFLVIILTEAFGLGLLQYNRTSYANYWHRQAHQAGEFTYVALGDSVAQGLGATTANKGYVAQLGALIKAATGKTVRIVNLSRTGATVQDVIDDQLPQLQYYQPDLVTLDVGANDMRNFDSQTFGSAFQRIVAVLPTQSVVANVPYAGGRDDFNRHAREANHLIANITKRNNLSVTDIYASLSQQQSPWIYAADFYHPNDRGYVLWTKTFWKTILPLL